MIKNYLKTAIRNLYREKGLVSFSLLGLSVGLAAVILLMGYIRYELSYDTSYSNGDRVYRLVFQNSDLERQSVYVPIFMSNLLLNELPQIASATLFEYQGSSSFALNDDLFDIDHVHADSNFFKVFNLPVLYGNPNTALNANENIVINRKTALQFFGKVDAVGEQLTWKNIYGETRTFEVTGIIEEIPPNMHFKGDAVMASNFRRVPESIDWGGMVPYTSVYILLEKHANIQQVVDRLPEFYQKYNFPKHFTLQFQHVPSIHLHSNLPDEFFANSDIRYLYIFGLVALLILFVACANYINLATVRSLRRTKEIGMRKVLGSSQHALRIQFMCESFLFFGLALPLAFLISSLAWPWFAHVLTVPNQLEYLLNWQTVAAVLLVTLVAGFLSGAYPAFFLSRLKPIASLKNTLPSFRINFSLRKALIVFQFAISVSLIVATIVVNNQLHLLNNAQLGYNKDHLLVLKSSKYPNGSSTFKHELMKHSKVESVSVAGFRIGQTIPVTTSSGDSSSAVSPLNYASLYVDSDFLNTMQLTLLEGRFAAMPAERTVVLSRSIVDYFQLESPVSTMFNDGYVAGIIEDFNATSLKDNTAAVVLNLHPDLDLGDTYIRISPGNVGETFQYIRDTYKAMFPYQQAELSFVDDRLQQLYTAEQRLATLFNVFVSIAITIVCVGLFSLVALVVQQRTKEIGIRKVLGANTLSIMKLVTVDFLYLAAFACLIACPIAWWAMHHWLADYAYRIDIHWWIFAIAGGSVLLVTLLTVGWQAIRAAVANPVESLRDE